jgi:antitoxin component HigA of HigAB toxin-antitoxin module
MTATPRIATQENIVRGSLFPSYVPTSIRVTLYSEEHLLIEYSPDDSMCEFINKYRTNHNLTLKEFSQIIGFSESHICNVLHGKKPSQEFIDKIKFIRNNL